MSNINDLINFEYRIFPHRNIGECDDQYKERLRAYSFGMEVGMKHRQVEIDELQKRVKELELINFDSELHFDAAKEHIDRLQWRIDEALDHTISHGGYDDLTHIINILKGEETK